MSDNDFYQQLENATSKPISEASLENANKALASAASKTLIDSIKEIQQLVFDGNDIGARLLTAAHLIEKAQIASKDQAQDLRTTFIDLLWKSRSIAGDAKGAADDFGGDMMDMIMSKDVSNEDKINELNNMDQITIANGKDAANQPKNFQAFTAKLRAYADQVELEIGNKDSQAKQKLAGLVSSINDIDTQLKSLVTNVVTPIAKFLELGKGVFASVISGSPEAAFTALLTAVKSGVAELQQFDAQLNAAEQKRRALKAQREDLQKQVAALESDQANLGDASAVPASMRSIASDTDDFATRMSTFTDTFTKLSADQKEIQDFLKKNVAVDDPIFASHVSLLKQNLGIVSAILGIYSNAPTSNVTL
ncbi:hypothetical protein K474DRAFT_1667950 [Panus rudis PR-1116 ss-1]|nr:hypothetical protein K474DRAFT_1667950 [Panus rudis PR-1116 ss-1]